MQKKISIALATYNAKKYIEEQLLSLVSQTIRPDEIVISDDASSDETSELIVAFSKNHHDINFKIILNSKNVGPTFNFERAMKACTGDIVFLCDQDDFWKKEKIESTISIFDDESINLVFCDAYIWRKDRTYAETLWQRLEFTPNRYDSCQHLLRKTIAFGLTMAYRNTANLKGVLFPYPSMWGHDGWLALICSAMGEVGFVNKPLLHYRQHPTQVSGAFGKKSTVSKSITPDSNSLMKFVERVATVSPRGSDYENLVGFARQKSVHLYTREQLASQSLFFRTLRSLSLFARGDYHRYSNGFRSLLRDIYGK